MRACCSSLPSIHPTMPGIAMHLRFSVCPFLLASAFLASLLCVEAGEVVAYEAFGAAGDGGQDDLPAISKAHAHANAKGLPVRSNPKATYHLGRKALTVVIATDTDWSTSRFTIDDSKGVENHKKAPGMPGNVLIFKQIAVAYLVYSAKELRKLSVWYF